jgi:hypothetical protein
LVARTARDAKDLVVIPFSVQLLALFYGHTDHSRPEQPAI